MTQSNARYVQVNIGTARLSAEQREQFEEGVINALRLSNLGNEHLDIEIHEGWGRWKGTLELSLHISTVADIDLYALRVHLAALAKFFHQDAIGLIVGSDLIGPS